MPKLTVADRNKLHSLMLLLRTHAAQLDYPPGDVRGARDAWTWQLSYAAMVETLTQGGRLCFDCSQAAQQVYRWPKLGDPCGLGFAYAGSTGPMLTHLPHFDNPANAHVGTLIVYGPPPGDHVSLVLEPGDDPLLWSHGRSGLDIVRLSAQRTWHRAPVTLLSVAGLG